MKIIASALLVATMFIACNNEKSSGPVLSETDQAKTVSDSGNFTTIAWLDSTSIKLGKVKKGEVVEVAFRFKNTGDKPLVISNVTAGCGCTVPEKPEAAYAPGSEGVIKAKFDSKNQVPMLHTKPVTVEANTTPSKTHHLNFTVEITE